ncbi:FAD/NAD(P)-binding domain-containing protein [Acaromyces ingoldii]|uniref:FAD/NAD(P)-binding domain-containing protein n=1 Tax=Acaromyces ingoldii TaxID=215250 RepID=A0A316YCG0_9BASI|nr:FAD/NAD(P)-binding domain-containing protein [Acaromyces ingoldii]PWN86952.1 FAD/NAD(P)-binding domain-containing protein [Acaromyces ingoldii]
MTVAKTVLVVGGSYAGHEAVQALLEHLPASLCRVVLLERNSHFHHVYAFPRFSVFAKHEQKALIPYTNLFRAAREGQESRFVQGSLVALENNVATYTGGAADDTGTIRFDYLVYALGAQRPASIDVGSHFATKADSMERLRQAQRAASEARRIVVIGGGALGVQFASDLVDRFGVGTKQITLLSSSARLLPRFDAAMHARAHAWLTKRHVDVILGQRAVSQRVDEGAGTAGATVITTTSGRVLLEADLVLDCTGLTANTAFLDGLVGTPLKGRPAPVNRYMQLLDEARSATATVPHVFVVGDAADAFGALNSGGNARHQADVAARNIAALAQGKAMCERYEPAPTRIKVSLGVHHAVSQSGSEVGYTDGLFRRGKEDLGVEKHWRRRGLSTSDMFV